jgi:hypothetical protein
MKLHHKISIHAPIEKAFSWIEDDQKMAQWMNGFVSIDYVSEKREGNPTGMRFRQKLKEAGQVNEYMGEVVSYEYPYLFGVRLGCSAFVADVTYRLKNAQRGCTLEYEATFVFSNIVTKLMAVLFWWYTVITMRSQLSSFKKTVETETGNAS